MAKRPRPWPQHQARTIFIRVPLGDWPAVKRGYKTEFRAKGQEASQVWSVETPTPVVAYSLGNGHRHATGHDARLMVLTATWREPLGAISPASLQREGFESMAQFRRYWMGRVKRRFEPFLEVNVYQVRQFTDDDRATLGTLLLERLYGEHLDP